MIRGMIRRYWPGWAARCGLGALTLALGAVTVSAFGPGGAQAQQAAAARFLGVASCAGSTCHGRMDGDGSVVRQDELMRWQEPSTPGGAHARAYAVLSNNRSQFIARNLGIGDAAAAPMCLGCHSSDAVGGSAHRSDGVGCESCHAPSGGWIASHYAGVGTTADPDAEMRRKHLANLSAGLMKLEDPRVRARVCLDCHYGAAEEGQFVTHRIMAAGHPRIAFEIDLFSTLQAHHAEDRDYSVRKGAPDHIQLWAVGQAAALGRALALFQTRRGTAGVFPEFTFYDCHSCHRRIFDAAKPVRSGVDNPARGALPEGMPPFNDENMIMLAAAARLADAGLASEFDARGKAFHEAMGRDRSSAVAAAAALAAVAARLETAFAARGFSTEDGFRLVDHIAGSAIAPRFTDYAGSVQAVMGIDTLLGALVGAGRITVGAAAGIRSDIDRAYGAVKDPNAYRPAEFQASLGSAVRAIRALR